MAAQAAAGGGAVDPVSAIAQAIGEGFKVVGAGLGIIAGRDDTYRENNAYRYGYAQMENATNAQRLQYLQGAQSQSTKTLLVIASMMAVIILSFAFLHKHR